MVVGPLVSVVLVTKDRPDRLRRAVDAVGQSTYGNVELIIQDGSTDSEPLPPVGGLVRVDHRVEPDDSIAHAANLGMARTRGDILHFACDDDCIMPDTIANAVSGLFMCSAEWTYASIRVVELHGLTTRMVCGDRGGADWDPRAYRLGNYVPQPSVFWTRHAWELCGPFDASLPLCFDYEMWGRFGSRWDPTVREHVDAEYEVWPGSTSVHSQGLQEAEVHRIKERWRVLGFGRREGE